MAKYAKWLGGTFGWALGGPIGALLGFAVGSLYDNASGDASMKWGDPQVGSGQARTRTTAGDFEASLLILTAAVMKADNAIKKSELDFVKSFLKGQFGEEKAQQQLNAIAFGGSFGSGSLQSAGKAGWYFYNN